MSYTGISAALGSKRKRGIDNQGVNYIKDAAMETQTSSNRPGKTPGQKGGTAGYGAGTDRMVTGLFPDRESAERAYRGATARGYGSDDINVMMSDDTRKRHFGNDTRDTELGNKAAEGAGIGGAVGGTLGAIAAAVAAVGTSLALPGLGLVIAGPIAAAVAGAGAGGAAGSLVGALVGWGIPEERVKDYEDGLKRGGILMGVNPRSDTDADTFQRDWTENRGQHIKY